MKKIITYTFVAVLIVIIFLLTNCSNDFEKTTTQEKNESVFSDLKVLLEYEKESKKLKIYQTKGGEIIIEQAILPGEDCILTESMDNYTLDQIYNELYPGKEVPQDIVNINFHYEYNKNSSENSHLEFESKNGEKLDTEEVHYTTRGKWDTWFFDNYCSGADWVYLNCFYTWQEVKITKCKKSYAWAMVYSGTQSFIKITVDGKTVASGTIPHNGYAYHFSNYSPENLFGTKLKKTHKYRMETQNLNDGNGWSMWHWSGTYY